MLFLLSFEVHIMLIKSIQTLIHINTSSLKKRLFSWNPLESGKSSILFNFIYFVKFWRTFLGLNPKESHLSLEKGKGNLCCVHLLHKAGA